MQIAELQSGLSPPLLPFLLFLLLLLLLVVVGEQARVAHSFSSLFSPLGLLA